MGVAKNETNIWDDPKYANDEELKKYMKQLDMYFLDMNRFLENEKIIVAIISLFVVEVSYAQDIEVKKFEVLEKEQTAVKIYEKATGKKIY